MLAEDGLSYRLRIVDTDRENDKRHAKEGEVQIPETTRLPKKNITSSGDQCHTITTLGLVQQSNQAALRPEFIASSNSFASFFKLRSVYSAN
jgi:hypothetical protein